MNRDSVPWYFVENRDLLPEGGQRCFSDAQLEAVACATCKGLLARVHEYTCPPEYEFLPETGWLARGRTPMDGLVLCHDCRLEAAFLWSQDVRGTPTEVVFYREVATHCIGEYRIEPDNPRFQDYRDRVHGTFYGSPWPEIIEVAEYDADKRTVSCFDIHGTEISTRYGVSETAWQKALMRSMDVFRRTLIETDTHYNLIRERYSRIRPRVLRRSGIFVNGKDVYPEFGHG